MLKIKSTMMLCIKHMSHHLNLDICNTVTNTYMYIVAKSISHKCTCTCSKLTTARLKCRSGLSLATGSFSCEIKNVELMALNIRIIIAALPILKNTFFLKIMHVASKK